MSPNIERVVRAPRGTERSCQSWAAEAAMRMLMNNLDPDVAEDPSKLVVYGGRGRAARSWAAYDAIVATLRRLAPDETLLVQSGKPVGVVRTHEDAPRVLIANSNLVPHWATQEHFDALEAQGLMMFGQMTAGSWIYIGTQGILQGTYETFAECARQALQRNPRRNSLASPPAAAAWAAPSPSPSRIERAEPASSPTSIAARLERRMRRPLPRRTRRRASTSRHRHAPLELTPDEASAPSPWACPATAIRPPRTTPRTRHQGPRTHRPDLRPRSPSRATSPTNLSLHRGREELRARRTPTTYVAGAASTP